MDRPRASEVNGIAAPAPDPTASGFAQFSSSDAVQLSQQAGEWNFEVAQLSRGTFHAESSLLGLDSVSLLHIEINQTVSQRGYGPRNMAAIFIPVRIRPPHSPMARCWNRDNA